MRRKFLILCIFCVMTKTIIGQALKVGQVFEDGIIAHINKDGKSGLLVTEYNILNTAITWNEAAKTINEIGSWGGLNVVWRLPTCQEMQLVYQNLYLTNLMEFILIPEMDLTGARYWVSNHDPKYNRPQQFDFEYGTCELIFYKEPNSDSLHMGTYYWARAVRTFKINSSNN